VRLFHCIRNRRNHRGKITVAVENWVFGAPVTVYVAIVIAPLLYSFYYSLTDWNGSIPTTILSEQITLREFIATRCSARH